MKLQNLEKPSAAVSDTVDVIADSNYSNVSEAYNHAFRAWRNKEDNPYAFRCKKQKKEAVYIEGKGFHEPDPAAEERRSLIQITMVIGMAIFAYLLIENLLTAILMGVAQIAGMDVGYCYSDGTVYGSSGHSDVQDGAEIHGACADPPVLFPHAAACGVSLEAGFTAGVSGCYCGDTDRFCGR